MDSLRGRFSDRDDYGDRDYDLGEDDTAQEAPPSPVGQDERRMQVRAYNHWASLLGRRSFPSIEDLEPQNLPDFSPYSVLLDFTGGIEDPGIPFLGDKLAEECSADGGEIDRLSDVPSRSLLSRITDHYMQILANQAPIGFEAEFVNVHGATILYRGILLPFSSDDDTIDFIYGVINWKELADQKTSDELLLEIDQALSATPEPVPDDTPLTAWADGPAGAPAQIAEPAEDVLNDEVREPTNPVHPVVEGAFDASPEGSHGEGFAGETDPIDWPTPAFGATADSDDNDEPQTIQPLFGDNGILAKKDKSGARGGLLGGAILGSRDVDSSQSEDDDTEQDDFGSDVSGGLGMDENNDRQDEDLDILDLDPSAEIDVLDLDPSSEIDVLDLDPSSEITEKPAVDVDFDLDPEDMGLADWLASAREMAQAAKGSEDRSRHALYAAIGLAYDFSLAAESESAEFEALVADAGITAQDRAPMTPVVKLVFGADYDKTRLTEYASALSHGRRLGIGRGGLTDFLAKADGGLKGVVQLERALKRQESGKPANSRETPSEMLARKLRKLEYHSLDSVEPDGQEFTLLVARRLPDGEVVLLGEVADDVPMLERAARKLLG
jgi:hypothetical protein